MNIPVSADLLLQIYFPYLTICLLSSSDTNVGGGSGIVRREREIYNRGKRINFIMREDPQFILPNLRFWPK